MKQFVIFDMDGVLIDSEPLHQLAEKELLKEYGIEVSTEALLQYMGRSTEALLKQFIQNYHLDVDYPRLYQNHQNHLGTVLADFVQPIDGIPDFLSELDRYQIPFAVASSSSLRMIHLVLEKMNWRDRFTVVVSGEEVQQGKPNPDIFLEAAKRLDATVESCVVVEDSNAGVRAGKAAHMRTIGFKSPHSAQQDISMADFVINDFSDNTIAQILSWCGIS